MKKEFYSDTERYLANGQKFSPRRFSVESKTDDIFRKEIAMRLWLKIFDGLGIECIHEPKVNIEVEKWCANYKSTEYKQANADFYLRGINAFVLVKGIKFNEENDQNYEAKELAMITQTPVAIMFADGKFRLVDFYDYQDEISEERNEESKVTVSDEAMLNRCRKCGEWYFCTNSGWWGCRNCGFYDGDNTASVCVSGDEEIREEKPVRIIEAPVPQKTKKNKR